MKLMLDLTNEETEKLTDVLRDYKDEGPYHSAWRSDEIETLSSKVKDAIAGHDTTNESVRCRDCLNFVSNNMGECCKRWREIAGDKYIRGMRGELINCDLFATDPSEVWS